MHFDISSFLYFFSFSLKRTCAMSSQLEINHVVIIPIIKLVLRATEAVRNKQREPSSFTKKVLTDILWSWEEHSKHS